MTIDAFIAELEAAIDRGAAAPMQAHTRFRDQPWWDSMAALTVLAVYDGNFNRQLPAEQLAACATLEDVWRLGTQA
jgi:acyl carrier protein